MFDLSWSHILILLVVALVVVGPKDLPKFLHMIGKGLGKMRRAAEQFRASFDEMARQSELDELRQEIAALRGERLPEHIAKEPPNPFPGEPLEPEPAPPEPEFAQGATPEEPIAPDSKQS